MIGQRVFVVAGRQINAAFQARIYLGQKSTMMAVVMMESFLSPSVQMVKFLNQSVRVK